MRPRSPIAPAAFAIALAVAGARAAEQSGPTALPPVIAYHTSPGLDDPTRVPLDGVYEVTFAQAHDYGGHANADDVAIRVDFHGPQLGHRAVGGFFYATLPDGTSLWKARLAPIEAGPWGYAYSFVHEPSGWRSSGTGAFVALDAGGPAPARFLRLDPDDRNGFLHLDGAPYWPHGFNDCLGVNDRMQIDGGDRFGAFSGTASTETYLSAYAMAGFDMLRFSQANCSPDLVDASLTRVDYGVAAYFDSLMLKARRHGFGIFYGLLGYRLPSDPTTPIAPELERFLRESVDRWGPYVDVWELQNERQASEAWIREAAAVVRDADPYGHPVTTSWQRPELDAIDINAPHWYQTEDPVDSDRITAQRAASWRASGKPVVVGEQGNSTPAGETHGNWLPDSARRMRLRSWTAFFERIHLLYWNNSWATNGSGGGAANLYLGPEERQSAHVLRWFVDLVDRPGLEARPASEIVGVDPTKVRGYLVRSSRTLGLYLRNRADRDAPVVGQQVTVDLPGDVSGLWLDPVSGAVLERLPLMSGSVTLAVPAFAEDVAFAGYDPRDTPRPIAVIRAGNPQADGDLDNDGLPDRGPDGMPFGVPPLTLRLDGTALPGHPADVTYRWSFGDGTREATTPVVEHTYPDGNWVTTLTVTGSDGHTASASMVVRATADPNPDRNDPPTLDPLPDRTVRAGELVLVSPVASDRELVGGSYNVDGHTNETVSIEAAGVPNGAAFEPWRGSGRPQLWWIPGLDQAGRHVVTFTAVDPDGARSTPRAVRIEVLPAVPVGPGPLPVWLPWTGRSR